MALRLGRIYEKPTSDDGFRILVDAAADERWNSAAALKAFLEGRAGTR